VERKRRKSSAGSYVSNLAVVLLVLLGAGELVVIGRALVSRWSVGPSGSLTLTSKPAGARVVIDGVVKGTTPATINVPVGPHSVEVLSNGPAQVMAVNIDKGAELSRYFELPSGTAPAGVRVVTNPGDAKVMVDGVFRGRSPLVVSGLNPGRHIVRVEQGVQWRERGVDLAPGTTAAVSVPIDPLPHPPQGQGWLAIWTPVELEAFSGGKRVGTSRSGPWQLRAGQHDLELSNAALGIELTKTVNILAGRSVSMDAGIPSGVVSISSSPGADIQIDGESIGQSPVVNRPLSVGQHDVTARHPQLGERRVSVTIMPETTLTLKLELGK
jgi:hypothetical protein